MGYEGSERTTRRAVAEAKRRWRAGHGRSTRPWITEPGLWMQWDYGSGPVIDGRATTLFCAWLAWSRFRVVIALREMIKLVSARTGISREDAYSLCSLAADLRVTQVVNGNKGVHVMLEKRHLTRSR